jgi:type IV secretory pathway VirB10-like protein
MMMVHGHIKDVMSRTLTIILVVILALPVLADEKKPEKTADAAKPQAPPDSPLVAAAKRANRLGKKPTKVITNATLKSAGANAHVSTTDKPALPLPKVLEPPADTPEMAAVKAQQEQRAKAAEQAEKDRKAKDEEQQKARRESAAAEEGQEGDASEVTGSTPPPQF